MTGKGYVVSLDGDRAKVRVISGSECQGCAAHGHCHGSEPRAREITVINIEGAQVSDFVAFEAASGVVILASALIWILPVISMIVGYLVAGRFAKGIWPVAASFLFLGIALLILKAVDMTVTGGRAFYPKIIRIIPAEDALTGFPDGCPSINEPPILPL